MATKDKGAKRKESNRKYMEKRIEEKRKEHGGSQTSPKNATRRSSTAVPVKTMPRQPNRVLEVIVANREPGWDTAQTVLDQRQNQANQNRVREQTVQTRTAAEL